jgi:hypothetical protein
VGGHKISEDPMNGIITVLCTWPWACASPLFFQQGDVLFILWHCIRTVLFGVSDTPAAEKRSAAKVFRHHHLPPQNRIVNEVPPPALLSYDTTVLVP